MTSVIGVDLGGTKILCGRVSRDGQVLERLEEPTRASAGPEQALDRMAKMVRRLAERGEVVALGIGSPGPLDLAGGRLERTPNLPGWDGTPLREPLARAAGLPAFLDNDANAAALGEYLFGAGQGAGHLVYLTVSTGIGGGLVMDGRIYRGATGQAGELGHMTLLPDGPLCGCGNRGCLEALAAGPSYVGRAQARLQKEGAGRLRQLEADGNLDAASIFRLAAEGDAVAAELVAEGGSYLGIGVASIINLLNPERIVIGGGVSRSWEQLQPHIEREVLARALEPARRHCRIEAAALGADSGLLGAAALAWEEFDGT